MTTKPKRRGLWISQEMYDELERISNRHISGFSKPQDVIWALIELSDRTHKDKNVSTK